MNPSQKPPAFPRVLVVEDEQRMRELLQRVLPGWGFEVATARSAEEAMRSAVQDPPDIAILDLNLPGEDGLRFFDRLRQRLPNVQGIVQTGFGSVESAQRAIHLDVVEFLTKPSSLGDLEQALGRAVRRLRTPAVLAGEAATAGGPHASPCASEAAADSAQSAFGSRTAAAGSAGKTLEEVERDHILQTLRRNAGNRTATAASLGISRRTLYYKIEEYQRQGIAID